MLAVALRVFEPRFTNGILNVKFALVVTSAKSSSGQLELELTEMVSASEGRIGRIGGAVAEGERSLPLGPRPAVRSVCCTPVRTR